MVDKLILYEYRCYIIQSIEIEGAGIGLLRAKEERTSPTKDIE
jgi:hypothetical protein